MRNPVDHARADRPGSHPRHRVTADRALRPAGREFGGEQLAHARLRPGLLPGECAQGDPVSEYAERVCFRNQLSDPVEHATVVAQVRVRCHQADEPLDPLAEGGPASHRHSLVGQRRAPHAPPVADRTDDLLVGYEDVGKEHLVEARQPREFAQGTHLDAGARMSTMKHVIPACGGSVEAVRASAIPQSATCASEVQTF